MTTTRWLRKVFGQSPVYVRRLPARRLAPLRLETEALELRLAPSTTSTFLSMPVTGYSGQEGGSVAAFPVSINQLQDGSGHVGLSTVRVAMTFPTGVFNFPVGGSAASSLVHLGSVPLSSSANNWTLQANSPFDGSLNVTLQAKTNLQIYTNNPANGGSLFIVNFPISNAYNPALPTDEAITIVSANGAAHTQVYGSDPGPGGLYVLSPAPPYGGIIMVNPVAQTPPSITTPQNFVIGANTSLVMADPGLLVGAHDPQGQTMMVDAINGTKFAIGGPVLLPSGATVTAQSSGAFSYVPAPDFVGLDSFTFTVMDQGGNVSDPGTVNVQVTATLSLHPEGVSSGPSGTVIREEVILDNPNPGGTVGALSAYNLAITYDSAALSIDSASVNRGSDIPDGWVFVPNASTPGVIVLGAYGNGSSISGPAPLVLAMIDFTITAGVNQSTAIRIVPSAKIGSSTATTQLAGSRSGDFSVNPALDSALFVAGVDTTVTVTGGSSDVILNATSLPDADAGAVYVAPAISAIGGDGGPYNYSADGDVPPGLTFNTVNTPVQYVLSGTPVAPGTYTFTVTATDTTGNSSSQSYTVMVNPTVIVTTTGLPDWTVNEAGYNSAIGVAGGNGTYTFSQADGVLPPGLTLSDSGQISGTPIAAGTYTFTVSATDTLGGSGNQTYTVVVNPEVAFVTAGLPAWTVNTDGYNQAISTTGGTGITSFSETGALPPGVTLSGSGVLFGTPTVAGNYPITVTATDSLGSSSSQAYTIVINPAVSITTAALTDWTVNKAGYSQTVSAAGGTGAFTFSLSANGLPPGLSMSSTGVISGIPRAEGSYTFALTATDSTGASSSQTYTVVINPIVTIPAFLPATWTLNLPGYNQTITAVGGTGSKTFAIASGALPAGLTLSTTGVISGVPTASGLFLVMVNATDTVGDTCSPQSFTILINPPVTITRPTLPDWTAYFAYSQTISASGGTGTVTFAAASGTLPTGVTLSSSGVLSGFPTLAGHYTFAIKATDAIGASMVQGYTVVITPALLITTSMLPSWTINQAGYSEIIRTTGGSGGVSFSVNGGALPDGLVLGPDGTVSGTPTATNTSITVTVLAMDSVGASVIRSYLVVVNPAVSITTTAISNWTVSQPGYNQNLTATGGTGGDTFAVTSGTLPTGITMSTSGVFTGTPTATGTFTYTVTATDTVGASGTGNYTVDINPTLAIATATLPNWTAGLPYSQAISTTGGTTPITFLKTSGTLPAGITLTSAGVLSGATTTAGSYTFTLKATDVAGSISTHSYTVVIQPVVAITTAALPNWTTGVAYSQTISASGGTGTLTQTKAAGTLPTGLALSSGGVLSGVPTAAGSFTFTVTATDSLGAVASRSYSVVINPAVTVTTATVLNATVDQPGYNEVIAVNGGTGAKSLAVTAGIIPAGLTLSSAGVLSGTATELGIYTFTVTATDTIGATANQTYTIGVYPAATTLVVTAPANAIAGTLFSVTVEARDAGGDLAGGYNGPVTLTSSAGSDILPTHIQVTNGTATIAVTLTTAGAQTIAAGAAGLSSQGAITSVSPGAFGQLLVAVVSPSTIEAGKGVLATVQAADAFGNIITSGYSGPSTVTASISPAIPASTFPTSVAINSFGFGFFLGVIDKVGSYSLTASSGAISGTAPVPVTVTAAPATNLAFVVQPTSSATGVKLGTVTVAIRDQFGNTVTTGSESTRPVTVMASGPGAFVAGSTTTVNAVAGVATFDNLTLAAPGTYVLGPIVPSLYVGQNSATFTVAPLQVVPGSFASSPSGFSLQFNSAYLVNSVTPVLYGTGFGIRGPQPSVILTTDPGNLGNTDAYVEGSLVLDPATNALTFVATNTALQVNNGSPILPDGTYTAVIRTGAANNGFQALDAGGGFLDGKATGTAGSGDFTATFTIAAGSDAVVWVPATADGPGQPLVVPGNNQSGGGYPVYLSDTTGQVTDVQVTFHYNPALLTVTGVTGAGFALSAASTPGQAILHYSGPALPMGSQTPIGFVTAIVPGGSVDNPTPYRAKDLLHLSNITINGGAIAAVGGDALHLVAYVGDANGNGSYSSDDAVKVTRAAIQVDSGFSAFPLVDPVIVADTDGSGFIPADAALQVNEAGVSFPTANLPTPPTPPGAVFQPIGNNVDPTLSLGVRGHGPGVSSDAIVAVDVNVDDAHPAGSTGLIAGHLALTYDPRQFTVSAADVHAGTVLARGDWSVVATIDPATGQIGITLSGSTPVLSTAGGSLVTIDFHQTSGGGWVANPSAIALVASVNPGGQLIRTALEDAQGTFTLTPAPGTADARLESLVLVPTPAVMDNAVGTGNVIAPAPVLVESRTAESAGFEELVSITGNRAGSTEEPSASPAATQGATEAGNVSATEVHAVVIATSTGIMSALTVLPVPFGAMLWINTQASTAQHLPDQVFQMLVRDVERNLAGHGLLSLSPADNLDRVNWNEVGGDLDWQAFDGTPARRNDGGRTDRQIAPPATEPQADVTPAAVDQYFAEEDPDLDF